MIAALVIGTLLSLVVLGYVLAPLVLGVTRQTAYIASPLPNSRDISIAALREIEFDRATGKLSDADYADLRGRYASDALTAMRSASQSASDDPAEAAIRAYRNAHPSCARCGLRPELDAIYCSNCGSFLPGKCGSCGIAVTSSGVRFCIDCGRRLAA